MSNGSRILLGVIALLMWQLSPASAFHVPGHIPPTGTCRDPECMEQRGDEDKNKDKPKEKPCDDEKLKQLKAKRDAKLKAYKEIVAAAEDTKRREAEAIAETQGIFGKYMEDAAVKGQLKVQYEVFNVPESVRTLYKVSNIANSSDSWSKKMLKFAKTAVEQLGKQAGYKNAVERAKWIDTAVSGLLMDAMVVMKLNEADRLAEQGYNQWLRAYEALTEARHLEDQIRKLEAQCKAKPGGGGSSSREESDAQTSGERDAEAAQRMLDGWKKVEGGFEDSEGNFYDADLAFEQALAIVQSQQSYGIDGARWLAAFFLAPRPMPVKDMTEADMDAEWNTFREPLRRAYELVIRALEDYHRAEQHFSLLAGSRP